MQTDLIQIARTIETASANARINKESELTETLESWLLELTQMHDLRACYDCRKLHEKHALLGGYCSNCDEAGHAEADRDAYEANQI
jgi:hypothetical protein